MGGFGGYADLDEGPQMMKKAIAAASRTRAGTIAQSGEV